jgi:predicted GIY-YIG superfamily endonuclease
MGFWAYMLGCVDGSFYVGHTDNLERRLAQHASGELGGYTSTRLPVSLVWSQEFPSREEALKSELQIKNWSRAKKQALIRSDWATISKLSRGKNRQGRPKCPSTSRPPLTR